MKKNITYISMLVVLGVMAVVPMVARGQTTTYSPPTQLSTTPLISNPFNCGSSGNSQNQCTLTTFITAVLNNVVMPIGAIMAVVFIIWAGFSYVIAQGKPAEIQKAHARLLWALVGTGILLGAAGISAVIQTTVASLTAH